MDKCRIENHKTARIVLLVFSVLLVLCPISLGVSEQLTKIGNSHAIWSDNGQVQVINVDNPVVENIEL
ncbi:MAG: hypothetical protein ABIG61_00390, partial [Planctomycetota bacterium]